MNQQKRKQLLTCALYVAAGAAALVLLPLMLPVVLGILAAAALGPLILRLQKKTGMGRSLASAVCVTGALLVLSLFLWVLGKVLLHEAISLSNQLPGMLETIAGYAGAASRWISSVSDRLPGGVGDALRAWSDSFLDGSGTLAQGLYQKIFALVSGFLGALPDSLFFVMTMILSCYFAAGELPRIQELLRMRLPARFRGRMDAVTGSVKTALGGWVRAQLGLMGVTFLVLTVGFLLLRVDSPLLLGLGVSVLDALPLFGTGAVLIPWSLVSMMTGELGLGLGLLGLYGAAALLRNVLEPKLLGAQLGISPLLTLFAIYAGWKVAGFWGMVIFPVAVMVATQLLYSARAAQPDNEAFGWRFGV